MLKLCFLLFFYISLACCGTSLKGHELLDTVAESLVLQNIRQVTTPAMGFERAGEAYFSPDGQHIVFQAVPEGQKHYQIYMMSLSDGVPHLVSTGRGACTCAFFRPDGAKIIFASSHDDPRNAQQETVSASYQRKGKDYRWDFIPYMNIYEANCDGTELTPLTSGEAYSAECAYSPDGQRIVFASNRNGSMNIYTMAADGTDVRQVTNTTSCYNGGPFYSPNGHQILFRADRDRQHYLQIYVTGSDGEEERQLTFNEAVNWAPYWHPNGEVIAFTTSLHGHTRYEIYGLNLITGEQKRLTNNPTFDGLAVFSNDGCKMLWTSKRGTDATCQLFIADFHLPNELERTL